MSGSLAHGALSGYYFAHRLTIGPQLRPRACVLAGVQTVLALAHGFIVDSLEDHVAQRRAASANEALPLELAQLSRRLRQPAGDLSDLRFG